MGATIILICDWCLNNWHVVCFTPPLKEVLIKMVLPLVHYARLDTYSCN
jgi:hypothetical protein